MRSPSAVRGFNPLHRITGALVLVVAAVVVVPLVIRLPEGTQPPGPAAVVSQPATTPAPSAPQAAPPPPSPVVAPTPALPAPPAPVASAPPAPSRLLAKAAPAALPARGAHQASAPGWFVQVGAFTRERAAQAMIARLKHHGWPVRPARQTSAGRLLYAVWVGPFATREVAHGKAATLAARGIAHPWVTHSP